MQRNRGTGIPFFSTKNARPYQLTEDLAKVFAVFSFVHNYGKHEIFAACLPVSARVSCQAYG
jgi:hypothetical protein